MTYIVRGELVKFVQRTKQMAAKKPQMNEPNTKFKVIGPLLNLLGWDEEEDIELEYPVRVGSTTAKVDYALRLNGAVSVFVEAKGFDTDISKGEMEQVLSYGRIEGVKWAVVTNGKTLYILNTECGKTPEACLFEKLDLDSYISKLEILDLLSRKSVETKKIDDFARRQRAMATFLSRLEKNRGEITSELCRAVTKYRNNLFDDAKGAGIIDGLCDEAVEHLIQAVKAFDASDDVGVLSDPEPRASGRSRGDIKGNPKDEVAIFPSTEDGISFLKKYNAWGYVKLNRSPRFFALYVAKPYSKILYLGEIERVTPRLVEGDRVPGIDEKPVAGKQVVFLKKNSLIELSDPIPTGPKGTHVQGLVYTTLGTFISAKTTKDIFDISL